MPIVSNSQPHFTHKVFKTDRSLEIIAFESAPFPDPQMVPRIHRYYLSTGGRLAIDDGLVLGQDDGGKSVLLIKSTRHSLVQLVEYSSSKGYMTERFFQVGQDFEVIPLHSGKEPVSRSRIESVLRLYPPQPSGSLTLQAPDMMLLFDGGQPGWLQNIIDAQLNHWRAHHLEHFYRFCPWTSDPNEIWRCVKRAPFWALARWKDQMTPYQVALCTRTSLRGAVSFAIESLPLYLRWQSLDRYPAEALIHAADKLTEDEILRCACQEPEAALSSACRQKLSPYLRAKVLAKNYRRARPESLGEPSRELEREITESIVEFPVVWLDTHGGNFAAIIEGLNTRLSIKPEPSRLLEMLDQFPPLHRQAFAEFVSTLI